MRLTIPDVAAAEVLAREWAEGPAPVASWEVLSLRAAERALRAGHADLAFLPTLAVLRDPDFFEVIPSVALVGRAVPSPRLRLRSPLDAIRQVGIDPAEPQAALLAQIVLKEHYGAQPQFVPLRPDAPLPDDLDAVLLPGEAPATENGTVELDLGQEWFELTTRPMVWALLACRAGEVTPEEAVLLRDAAVAHEEPATPGTEPPAAVTLGAYAHAGLDDLVHHLYYHRALADLPQIPFVVVPPEDEEGDDEGEDA